MKMGSVVIKVMDFRRKLNLLRKSVFFNIIFSYLVNWIIKYSKTGFTVTLLFSFVTNNHHLAQFGPQLVFFVYPTQLQKITPSGLEPDFLYFQCDHTSAQLKIVLGKNHTTSKFSPIVQPANHKFSQKQNLTCLPLCFLKQLIRFTL